MAIIVLKGADFSANNIGRITLPANMHVFTKQIFNVCTKYSIYSEQATLINSFIEYLDSEGLLDHISMMMAPWLASDITEATCNIVDALQFSYDEGVSFNDGVLKSTNINNRVKFPNNLIPASNFLLMFNSADAIDFMSIFSGEGDQLMTVLPATNKWQATISRTFNPGEAYGYKLVSALAQPHCLIYNIKGLSDLDSNGTTVNGVSVTPGTGYSKTSEPLTIPNGFVTLVPQRNTTSKQIYLTGDGITLTSEQITSLLTAMTTLYNGLAALEG